MDYGWLQGFPIFHGHTPENPLSYDNFIKSLNFKDFYGIVRLLMIFHY